MQDTNIYAGYRYPSQIISHAVWLYHRFTLSIRDIEELLAARGIAISYETVRNWCDKFGQRYCSQIRKNRGQLGDTWYLDEVFIKINGVLHYLGGPSIRMVMRLTFWFRNAKTRKQQFGSSESD
jgi:putative transposase